MGLKTQCGRVEPGVDRVLKDTQSLVQDVGGQIVPLASSIKKTVQLTDTALVQAKQTLETIEGVTGRNSPVVYELTNTLKELAAAASSIRAWASYLERHPEALIRGKR